MNTKRLPFIIALLLFVIGIFSASVSMAQRSEIEPEDAIDVDVEEKLDKLIPLDLEFKNERDQTVQLDKYFNQDKPVLLTLVYYQCPMLCNVILEGVVRSLKEVALLPGKDFEIVTASFNPLETPTTAQAWKQKYIKDYENPAAASGWHFLTGKNASIKPLANAVGFKYQWVERRQEYAHAAVIMVLTPDGRMSRYLYGVEFNPKTLRLSLVEASEGKIGTTLDKFILTCYYYDDSTGKYAPLAMNIMRLGGGLTVLILGAALAGFWHREHRKERPNAEGAQA